MTVLICQRFKARLTFIHSTGKEPYNWLFLPGGPGLGSESLHPLTKNLLLPGTMWHLDLPGDGSNLTDNETYYYQHWCDALLEAVAQFQQVILVAHSTGGMYALATKELKNLLAGIVLMDSAPDRSWQDGFARYVAQHPLPNLDKLQQTYATDRTNQNLKQVVLASRQYLFTSDGLKKNLSFFEHIPYNASACEWSAHHFDGTYRARWVPDNMPALIFAGDQDPLTPLNLFADRPAFVQTNILLRSIDAAGHYPWIENIARVKAVFEEFCELFF